MRHLGVGGNDKMIRLRHSTHEEKTRLKHRDKINQRKIQKLRKVECKRLIKRKMN